jgi:hypothetical protein
MNPLIEKIRKARQTRVTVDGKTFIVRRPTDWEAIEMAGGGESRQMDFIERFVEGWEGITELDLIPSGDSVPVPFDHALFVEWIADQPKYWGDLTSAITKEYSAHAESLVASEKK